MPQFLSSFRSLRSLPAGTRRVLAAAGINQLGSVLEGFLVVYLVHEGFSAGAAATAAGMFALGTLLGAPVGAWATGLLAPRRAMTAALTVTGLLVAATPLVARSGHLVGVCAVALLAGVSTQAFRPPSSEALSRATPAEDSVLVFSAFRVAMNTGGLLAPVLAAAAIARGWWTALFVMDALTCVVAAALVATSPAPPQGAGLDQDDAVVAPRTLRGLFTPTRWLYLAAMATSGVVYCQTFSTLPLQLDAAGQPGTLYALILTLGAATLVLLELPMTTATQAWPVPRAVLVGTLVFGLSYALYAFPRSGILVVLGAVLAIAGTTISAPRLWSHPASSPAAVRPAFFAASHAAFGTGMAVGPIIGVTAWQQIGQRWWPAVAAIGVVSALAGWRGTRDEPRVPTPTTDPAAVPLS